MITHRPAAARGHANHGWLDSFHSFSFADYHDPAQMGFRALRVVNEDRVAGGGGFPTHAHSDMEIVTYIVDGALEHKDSTGTGAIILPGDAQRMSAGTGIRHSEFNASTTAPVHLLQIWLLPNVRGIAPGYEQATLPSVPEGDSRLDLIGGPDGGAVTIRSDATLHRAIVGAGGTLEVPISRGHAWVQAVKGNATLGDLALAPGDGAAVTGETALHLASEDGAELLVFDLS
ncbi:pirin family protein [Glacieibacterium frigidum]|uniref:Pirin family protein n=1 Tax=Glacieibacterium frigidum TaxID=2593303 RepID=A0A552UFS0_9SPHN|nr:pirin family protein [Glacieibacterium frigidum]TRW17072.1 pirin family protein [Glacieibacterium frigidum]